MRDDIALSRSIPRWGPGKTVATLIAGRDIRILDDTGELIRQLTLDPSRIEVLFGLRCALAHDFGHFNRRLATTR